MHVCKHQVWYGCLCFILHSTSRFFKTLCQNYSIHFPMSLSLSTMTQLAPFQGMANLAIKVILICYIYEIIDGLLTSCHGNRVFNISSVYDHKTDKASFLSKESNQTAVMKIPLTETIKYLTIISSKRLESRSAGMTRIPRR